MQLVRHYLVFVHSRLALSDKGLLDSVRYSLDDGVFVEKMHFLLGRMHVHIDRLWVNLQAVECHSHCPVV